MPVNNTETMTTAPAEIPIYKSQVAMGILVSLFFKLLAYWRPEFGELDEDTRQGILLGISAIGDFVALAGRIWSKIQPIVFSPRNAAIVLVLMLGGCATLEDGVRPAPTIVQTIITNSPTEAQTFIRKTCGWLEPLTSLTAILGQFGGLTQQALDEICDATRPSARRMGRPQVRSIVLQGRRVSP
jgi:hypothetical protein